MSDGSSQATRKEILVKRPAGTLYQCMVPNCGKSFKTSYNFTAHLRLHSDTRPFVCDHEGCEKSYTRKECLRRHQLSHTAEKNHACSICNKKFLRKDELPRHMKQVHSGKNDDAQGGKIIIVDFDDDYDY